MRLKKLAYKLAIVAFAIDRLYITAVPPLAKIRHRPSNTHNARPHACRSAGRVEQKHHSKSFNIILHNNFSGKIKEKKSSALNTWMTAHMGIPAGGLPENS